MIVYDFDGVIADSLSAIIEIYNRFAQKKGFKLVTADNLADLRSKSLRQVFQELGVAWWRMPGLMHRGRKEFAKALPDLKIQPGLKDLILKIKDLGREQAIVSTNSTENIRGFLQKNNLDIFEIIYGGGSLFNKAKNIKRLIKNYNLRPGEIIYVGDEVRDIEAAQKAGVKIISVSWGFNTKEVLNQHNPGRVIDKPEDILNLI